MGNFNSRAKRKNTLPPILALPFRNLIGQVFRTAEPNRRCLRPNLKNFLLYVGRERVFLYRTCQGWIKPIRSKKRARIQKKSKACIQLDIHTLEMIIHFSRSATHFLTLNKISVGGGGRVFEKSRAKAYVPTWHWRTQHYHIFHSSVFSQFWIGLSCL